MNRREAGGAALAFCLGLACGPIYLAFLLGGVSLALLEASNDRGRT